MKSASTQWAKLEKVVRTMLPAIMPQARHFEAYSTLNLPRPANADFQVAVFMYEDGEPQITASIPEEEREHDYFCYLAFEIADYSSDQARFEDFETSLGLIVRNPSRIVQEKGMMLWDFSWECQVGDEWVHVGGVSCLRASFSAPKIQGRKHVYRSPPLQGESHPGEPSP